MTHTHYWYDPKEPPIARAPYSPVIGWRSREMKPGRTYECRECHMVVHIKERTAEEAMQRPYIFGDNLCAVCSSVDVVVLFHDIGGWWCREHRAIPDAEWERRSRNESLDTTIRRFVDYHS